MDSYTFRVFIWCLARVTKKRAALQARFAAAVHAGVDAIVNAPDAEMWLTEWRERPGTARLANHVLFEPLLLRLINEYRLDPHADLV